MITLIVFIATTLVLLRLLQAEFRAIAERARIRRIAACIKQATRAHADLAELATTLSQMSVAAARAAQEIRRIRDAGKDAS